MHIFSTDPPVLPPPGHVRLLTATNNSITIGWDPVIGARRYVTRYGGYPYYNLMAPRPGHTVRIDDLPSGRDLRVSVLAENREGCSLWTPDLWVRTLHC